MADDKRLKDMEASIKAIAEFVKEQAEKIESEGSSREPDDYKNELDDIRRKIDSFDGEKEFSRLQFKKLDKLEQTLDERIGHMEELIKNSGDEKIRKSLQATRTELDSLKRDVMSKLKFFDEKFDKAKDDGISGQIDGIETRLESMKKELTETKAETKKIGIIDIGTYKKELENFNIRLVEDFKTRSTATEKVLNELTDKLNRDSLNKDSIHPDFEKFQGAVTSRLQILDKGMKEIAESEMGEIRERVSQIDNKLNESLVLKNHLDDMEKNLNEMRSIANRLKGFDAENYKKEFERRMDDVLGQFKLEPQDIKNLNEMVLKFKNLESQDINKLSEMLSEVKKLEDEDINNIKNLSGTVSNLRNLEVSDIKRLSDLLETLKEAEVHDLSNFMKQIRETRELMEDESVNRISIEKRMDDMEASTEKFERYFSDTLTQLKKLELQDVKKLNDMFSKFEELEGYDISKLSKQLKDATNAVEDESVSRVSMEKRLSDIESTMGRFNGIVSHIENAEGLDIRKLSDRIQDMETNMKMSTVKVLTHQLNEFAKSLDKRLPNVVAREEYLRQVADINQRLRNIEAPDLAPLGMRVERLEKKIEEVASMMRSVYNRIPIVVE